MRVQIPSAARIRAEILTMAYLGQSVHVPSAFSVVELVRVLHSKFLRFPGNDPNSSDRDYLVLSKGHGVMSLYPIFVARGWLDQSLLDAYFRAGSPLPGLAEASIPGIEANSGSLGQGIGLACGLALAAKLRGSSQKVFCIIGDGELNEGSTYEALSFATHHQLSNLTILLDSNGFQAMGPTKEILGSIDGTKLFVALGFSVTSVDGHDEEAIERALSEGANRGVKTPRAIIANTVKGKGISFMENANDWHYTKLDRESFSLALSELGAY